MITFKSLGKHGRFGNQLFQVAFIMAMANRKKTMAAIPNWPDGEIFEKQLTSIPEGHIVNSKFLEPQFNYLHHIDNWIPNQGNVDVLGYFQSEKYFEQISKKIKEQFRIKRDLQKQVFEKHLAKFAVSSSEVENQVNLCSLCIRRGDYVNNPNYAQLKLNYYILAMEQLPPNTQFIVISDDKEWCRQNIGPLRPLNIHISEAKTPLEDFILLTLIKNHIIANSTFHWWGAWLAEQPDSIIIAPEKWNDGPLLASAPDTDIVPERWIKLNPEGTPKQIDLGGVTFTLPYKKDHADRAENFDAIKNFLYANFINIEILVSSNVAENNVFHRTAELNKLAKQAQFDIIFNWDTDIIVNPKQVLAAVEKIRSGAADMVYPYDGRFLRLERSHLTNFVKSYNANYFRGLRFPSTKVESFGGVVAWNKQKFFSIGGENENFIDYAPEDWERIHRARMLGLKIERIPGPLFHFNHNVSSQNHAFIQKNNEEFDRIKSMDPLTLRAEVKTWPSYVG